jgi:guanidinopropionase
MSSEETTNFDIQKAVSGYMYYFGIPTFLGCPYDVLENADIGLIGIPYIGGNPIERTQYLAPRAIRDFSKGFHRSHREFR